MNDLSTANLPAMVNELWLLIITFVPRLLAAGVILAVALFLSRRIGRAVLNVTGRVGRVDPTIRFVLSESIRYAIIILALIAALDQLGIRTTSLYAILGAAGLAIGLALQGTLSNIAAGVMLLWLRPFRIGDYIEVNGALSGTVREMGLFTCEFEAFDGLYLFVPNSALWNVPLRNFTRNPGRLISLSVTIPRTIAVEGARQSMVAMATADRRVATSPEPLVFVDRVGPDSSILIFRVWSADASGSVLQRDLVEATYELFSNEADRNAVQVVRTVPSDADPTRLLSESAAKGSLVPRHR
jgi:small conductance mechanosensitive channel